MNNISTFDILSSFEQCLMGGELSCPNVSILNDSKTLLFTPQNNYAQYLYIEPLESNANVKFVSFSMYSSEVDEAILSPRNTLKYSINRTDWFDMPEEGVTINNQRIYFKCENPITDEDFDTYEQGIGTFIIDKCYNVGGNIMSLIYGDDFIGKTDLTGYDYAFSQLFNGAVVVTLPGFDGVTYPHGWCIDASNLVLPAMTLTTNCYCCMFGQQLRLCNPPSILPAEILAEECYAYMFSECELLTTAPIIKAMQFADFCFQYMFMNTAIKGPVTFNVTNDNFAIGCLYYTFNNTYAYPYLPNIDFSDPEFINSGYCQGLFTCSAVTDEALATMLPINPETGRYWLPVTELIKERCYSQMFYECDLLKTAPELPATTLSSRCYEGMFNRCTSLETPPPILPATTLTHSCYNDMFAYCKSLTYTPVLVDSYYEPNITSPSEDMFFACTSLTKITCLWKTNNENDCISQKFNNEICNRSYMWIRGVPNVSTSTFIMSNDATWKDKKENSDCGSGVCGSWIPNRWTVEYV